MKRNILFGVIALSFLIQATPLFAKTINLDIKAMTCSMCAAKIEGSIKKVEGVTSCSVDHNSGKGVVNFDESKTNADKILEACNRSGFKCDLGS